MSFVPGNQLRYIAKVLCRDLRKRSTHSEKIMWEVVRNRKFENLKINRQYPIFYDLDGKESFFIADFYCHQIKFIIEIDGGYHERQKEYDKKRTEIINLLGIKVIRFKNEEVENDIKEVKTKLKQFITLLLSGEKALGDVRLGGGQCSAKV